MMVDTEQLAHILEMRDRDLIERLAKWFRTVGRNLPLPTSDDSCKKLAEIILVYPDRDYNK